MPPSRSLYAVAAVVLALAGEAALSLSALAREIAERPALERRSLFWSGEARADAALGRAAPGWRAARAHLSADASLWVAVDKSEPGLGAYMCLITLFFGRKLHLAPVPAGETITRPFAESSVELWLLDLTGGRVTPAGASVVERGDGFVLWKL